MRAGVTRGASTGRGVALALASLMMACNAFDEGGGGDEALPAFFDANMGPPGAGAAGLSPGLGWLRDAATAGVGGPAGATDAALPLSDAGADAAVQGCIDNPPGCERLEAQPVVTQQPCVLALTDVRVDPGALCRGEVVLAGVTLSCGDPDGWTATADGTLLVLLGEACTRYLDGDGALRVTFPCDAACRVGDAGAGFADGEDDAGGG